MKKLLLVVLALVIVAAVAGGAYLLSDKSGGKIDAAKVARDARKASEATKAVARGDRPPAGPYTYVGGGSEQVDSLGGSKHVYPKQLATVVTLDGTGCQWRMKWLYVQQRTDEDRMCSKAGTITEQSTYSLVTFFNIKTEEVLKCDAGADRFRPGAKVGATWGWTCASAESKFVRKATYVGNDKMIAGTMPVTAAHIRIVSTLSGAQQGPNTMEYWFVTGQLAPYFGGLPLKVTSDSDYHSKSILGNTHYTEKFAYTLSPRSVPKMQDATGHPVDVTVD